MFSYLLPFAALVALVQAQSHVCSKPVLVSPAAGSTARGNSIRTIAYSTDPLCLRMCVLYNGANIGCDDLAGVGLANSLDRQDEIPVGTHTFSVFVTGQGADKVNYPTVSSDPATLTIALPTPCPAPTILTPAPGAEVSSRQVTITGTFAGTPECPDVALYLYPGYIGLATTLGNTFSINTYAQSNVGENGVYKILAVAKSKSEAWVDSGFQASTSTFKYVEPPHVCSKPVLASPAGSVVRSNTVQTVAYSTDPLCNQLCVVFDNVNKGCRTVNGVGQGNAYTRYDLISTGAHTFSVYATGSGSDGKAYDSVYSDPVSFTVSPPQMCPVPQITSPAPAPAKVTSRSITIEGTFAGTPGCPGVALYIGGGYVGMATTSGSTFSLNTYAQSNAGTNGMYRIAAVAKAATDGWADSLYQNSALVFLLDVPACAQPVILSPIAGSVLVGYQLVVTGTFDPACPSVQITVNGVNKGYARTTGSSFTLTTGISGSGEYKVSAMAISSESPSLNSIPTPDLAFTAQTPTQCPQPRIALPFTDLTYQQSKTITVGGSTYAQRSLDCPAFDIFVNGVNFTSVASRADGSFSAEVTVPSEGLQRIWVVTRSRFQPYLNSFASVETKVLVGTDCPRPKLILPASDSVQQSSDIIIIGETSSRSDCGTIDIYVDNVKAGTPFVNSNQFLLNYKSSPGTHRIYAFFRSSVATAFDSDPSNFLTVTTGGAACPSPQLTSPLDNTAQNGGSISISGTIKSAPGCGSVQILVDGQSHAATVTDGAFSTTVPVTTEGSHTVAVSTVHETTSSLNSPPTSVTVRTYLQPCPAPVLISPKAGETSTTQIYFSGSVDTRPECGKIQVYMDGVLIYSTPTDAVTPSSRRKRAERNFAFAVDTANLASGQRQITVVSTGDNNGVQSAPIPIIVRTLAVGPVATGGLNRRRNRCSAVQTLCPFKSSGRIGFECIDDIDNNLERCGACDGPDCTEIANASDVACVQSQCVVSQCLEGFVLENNTCLPQSDGFVLQA